MGTCWGGKIYAAVIQLWHGQLSFLSSGSMDSFETEAAEAAAPPPPHYFLRKLYVTIGNFHLYTFCCSFTYFFFILHVPQKHKTFHLASGLLNPAATPFLSIKHSVCPISGTNLDVIAIEVSFIPPHPPRRPEVATGEELICGICRSCSFLFFYRA